MTKSVANSWCAKYQKKSVEGGRKEKGPFLKRGCEKAASSPQGCSSLAEGTRGPCLNLELKRDSLLFPVGSQGGECLVVEDVLNPAFCVPGSRGSTRIEAVSIAVQHRPTAALIGSP